MSEHPTKESGKRFHAAGICDCCDGPPEPEDENPNYGPGNPDWERDIYVLGSCPHGVNLDREFCPQGCRV